MKFEIVKNSGDVFKGYQIAIDGIVDESSHFSDGYFSTTNPNTLERLKTLTLETIKSKFDTIACQLLPNGSEWKLWIRLNFKLSDEESYDPFWNVNPPTLAFEPIIDYKEWNKFFSIKELQEAFRKEIESGPSNITYREGEFHDDLFYIVYKIEDEQETFGNLLDRALDHYKSLHDSVMHSLSHDVKSDLITTLFEFPEELKTSCKQYLMYFGQFLADLGINADTSIKEEANRVLFTVAPEDGAEALDKIREALNTFLNAPGSMDFGQSNNNVQKDIAQIQWEANVHHLKGQLALAQAIIETKNATIETLKISNFQLQEMVSTSRQLPEIPGDEKSKEEKIMGGVVSLKQYEGKGFEIDLAELFRKLKRRFKKP